MVYLPKVAKSFGVREVTHVQISMNLHDGRDPDLIIYANFDDDRLMGSEVSGIKFALSS